MEVQRITVCTESDDSPVIHPLHQKTSNLMDEVKKQSTITNARPEIYVPELEASNLEKTKDINKKLNNDSKSVDDAILFSPQLETFDFWQFDPSAKRDIPKRQMRKELEVKKIRKISRNIPEGIVRHDRATEDAEKAVETVDQTKEGAKPIEAVGEAGAGGKPIEATIEAGAGAKPVDTAGEAGTGAKPMKPASETISNEYEETFRKEEVGSRPKSNENKDKTEASAACELKRPERKFEIYLNVRLFTLNEVTVTMLENNVLEVYASHARREAHGMRFTRSCSYLYQVPENLSKEDLFVGWTDDEILVIRQKSSLEKFQNAEIPKVRKERILKLSRDPRNIMYMHDESIDQLKYVFRKTSKSEPPPRVSRVTARCSLKDITKELVVTD